MEDMLEKIYTYLAQNGVNVALNILAAILIFMIGRWVSRFLSLAIEKIMVRSKIDVTLAKFSKQLSYFILMAFVIVAALERLGFKTDQIVVALGAVGLAIGLALQGSLANFAAGILMIIFKPYKVGDFVEIAGSMGTVKELQIFNTIINSPENTRIIIPNNNITANNIYNYTANGNRRVDLVIGVSYGDDLKKAKQVIENVLTSDSRVLTDPKPIVGVLELADSSVNFAVKPFVKPEDYWPVYFDMTEKIKVALDENGITIPFPQRDLHIIEDLSKGDSAA